MRHIISLIPMLLMKGEKALGASWSIAVLMIKSVEQFRKALPYVARVFESDPTM